MPGKHFAVHGQDVEIRHLVGVRAGGARLDRPLAEHDARSRGRPIFGAGVARVDDEHAHHAHAHLGHLVVVRVVHEGPVLPERELVFERLARLDVRLRQARRRRPCRSAEGCRASGRWSAGSLFVT